MRLLARLMRAFTGGTSRQRATNVPQANRELAELERLRKVLEVAFSPETAAPGTPTRAGPPSRGHCAAVSAIVWDRFGGELVSATVQGQSHWFNRLNINGRQVDVDLTGDQFGHPAVRFGEPGTLCPGTRTRLPRELREETLRRAVRLAERAGLKDTQSRLLSLLNSATGDDGSEGIRSGGTD
jgi:hypothetical protein